MAKLRKRKTKEGFVYVLDFRYQDKRHVLSLKTSDRRTAEKVKANIEARVVYGTFRVEECGDACIRLSDFLRNYFDGAGGTKAESTIEVERIRTETFVEVVGDVPLNEIELDTLERWRAKRLEKVKPVTFNGELRVMKTVFNKAVEYGHIKSNPCRQLKKVREEQKRLYLTAEEVRRLFEYVELMSATARNKNYRAMYRKFGMFCEVLLNTGMRRGELLALRSDHIDIERNVILLEKTKGKKRREIPMTVRVKEILDELSPGMFSDMTEDFASHKFGDCARAAGIKGMKLHSLRHTFGTYLISMGYDITVVKELLGHEDIKTTLIYAKAKPGLLRDAIRSFEALGKNGYKMVTRGSEDYEKPLVEQPKLTSGS
jgi:integrase